MAIRARLLQAATALLYFGPLLAGLSGYGWAMLPPFVSIFVFWLMLLRPHQWPQQNRDWLDPQVLLSVLTQVVTQILLVAVLFGIGRGIGGVAGDLPMLHPFLPLAVSLLAVPVSRLVWNGKKALANGLTLDQVMNPAPERPRQPPHARPEDALRPLLAFADDAALAEVGPALEGVMAAGDARDRLSCLADALEAAPGRHGALREALAILATEPASFAANAAPTAICAAFCAAGRDPAVLRLLLPRAAALARMMPDRQPQFPDRAALESLAEGGLPGPLAADHAALMEALGHRAAPPRDKARARIGGMQPT